MYIKSIQLTGYRNYKNETVYFDKGTNILFGDNAQGKTNILESIFMCATTKSHKGSKDKEIVGFDEPEAHITLYFDKAGDAHQHHQQIDDGHSSQRGRRGLLFAICSHVSAPFS